MPMDLMQLGLMAGAVILIMWLFGDRGKKPIWEFAAIVPKPEDLRKEAQEITASKIMTFGAPANARLVYNGWTVGKVTHVLKQNDGKHTIYYFLVELPPKGLFGKKHAIVVVAKEDKVDEGYNVFVLHNAPLPVSKGIYVVTEYEAKVVTMDHVMTLLGEVLAGMRVTLPEFYLWANPATAVEVKKLQEEAEIENAVYQEKVKSAL